MKCVGIIQARMGSTRLPGKILRPLIGRPLLQVQVERLRAAVGVQEWWLATTVKPEDGVAAAWGEALGLRVFRGSENDVLSRFAEIARLTNADWLIRVTADDPFMDAMTVSRLVAGANSEADFDVLGPASPLEYPLGFVPELVRTDALLAKSRQLDSEESIHRTHVTSWAAEDGRRAAVHFPADWPRRPQWRWTVDTPPDLAMAQAAFELLGNHWREASYLDLVKLLDRHPEITDINVHVQQKRVDEG